MVKHGYTSGQVEVDMRDRYETEANVAGEEARRNRRKVAQLQESLAQALAAQDGMRYGTKRACRCTGQSTRLKG